LRSVYRIEEDRRVRMGRVLAAAAVAAVAGTGTAEASFTQELGSPFPVEADPYDLEVADFNGDGRPDLAVANGTAGTISILLRRAGGGFAQEGAALPAGSGTNGVAAADFNSDGRPDLASSNYSSGNGTVFLRNPTAGFSPDGNGYPVPGPSSVVAADFTGDRQPDLAFGSTATDSTYVFTRNAGAGFSAEGGAYPGTGHRTDLVAADFNGDGRLDLASANHTGGTVSILLRNPANNGFIAGQDITIGPQALKLTAADFNGDGRVDLAATSYGADIVALLLGQGNGTFVAEPGSPYGVGDAPYGVAAGDFNRDGAVDLAVANNGGMSVSVLLRSGAGFVPDSSSPIPTGQTGANGIAAADFDGDGRTDLAVSNQQSRTVTVLLNTTPGRPGPPAPLLDADGDGVQRPADCNDANPAIRPGARDKPGDKIDQDCNGRDARFPLLRRTIEAFSATYPGDRYTIFTSMTVKPVRRGDRLRLTCKGPGCEMKKTTIKVRKNARKLSLLRRLKGSKLRNGAVVQLRVTRPATIGRVGKWQIRAPKIPKITRTCLRPGAKKTSRCPR
jgi:FG-GAP-like repeat/Putative metal-binding motif/FG-GAP repeat